MDNIDRSYEEDQKAEIIFKNAYEGLQRAQKACPPVIDRFYNIGGYKICLRFAGEALIPYITRALSHMASEAVSSPDLTICICDSASTMVAPPVMRSLNEYVAGLNKHRNMEYPINMHFDPRVPMFSMLNNKTNLAIYWVKSPSHLPYYEQGSPLRIILHWWMQKQDRQIIHGAAIGLPQGGIILAGKGGSGKSTTTMACLDSQLLYAGDDWSLLAMDPKPAVHTLYNSCKLNADHLKSCLPWLLPMVSNAQKLDTQKALVFLNEHYQHKMITGFPVKAMLLPRITGLRETTLKRSSSSEILKAMFPDSFNADYVYATAQKSFNYISGFAKQMPCYDLELGTDLLKIPGVILGLLSEI